ncbi:hypothetical protein JWG44_18170 [Leptospira sp. 201903071]|uniref:hypothetical protein n=1 Tax=Leptospira ainazelensis TaxID=2810034 RepID=UPI001966CC49|nr:hypothetical protein [Leptospira ainazelensis]MBM9502185.1 hypothetical protein [Leptospira ainazelensis]
MFNKLSVNFRILILAILFVGFLIPTFALSAWEKKEKVGTGWDRKSLSALHLRFRKQTRSADREKISRKSVSTQEKKRKWWKEFYEKTEPEGCAGE